MTAPNEPNEIAVWRSWQEREAARPRPTYTSSIRHAPGLDGQAPAHLTRTILDQQRAVEEAQSTSLFLSTVNRALKRRVDRQTGQLARRYAVEWTDRIGWALVGAIVALVWSWWR